jgi:uncharacterized protein (DUF1330 family)
MTNHVNPSRESFRLFREHPRQGPVQMLNLVKFRARAKYDDGRASTGAEAYRTYGQESGPIFRALGGRIIWSGRPEVMVIGPEAGEDWDIAFIAEYPDMDAFTAMIRDPAYQAAAIHRTAAVENSRLIRMEPLEAGAGFG